MREVNFKIIKSNIDLETPTSPKVPKAPTPRNNYLETVSTSETIINRNLVTY